MNNLKRIIFSLVFGLAILVSAPSFAAAAGSLKEIQRVIHRYNVTSSVQMDVSKSVFMSIMGESKSSQGSASYAKGKLRLEMKAPEDSLVVMDQSTVWIVTPGVEAAKPQVAKIIAKDMKKRSRAPLALLFSQEAAWNEFKVVKSETKDNGKQIWLEPKDPKKWPDLRKITLTLSKDGKCLEQLSYEDELENKTEYVFKNIVTDQKLSARTFQYTPPPGAEVTIYK